jgi:hypothetical protein
MNFPWAVCSKYNHPLALHSSDAGFRADVNWWLVMVEDTLTDGGDQIDIGQWRDRLLRSVA